MRQSLQPKTIIIHNTSISDTERKQEPKKKRKENKVCYLWFRKSQEGILRPFEICAPTQPRSSPNHQPSSHFFKNQRRRKPFTHTLSHVHSLIFFFIYYYYSKIVVNYFLTPFSFFFLNPFLFLTLFFSVHEQTTLNRVHFHNTFSSVFFPRQVITASFLFPTPHSPAWSYCSIFFSFLFVPFLFLISDH